MEINGGTFYGCSRKFKRCSANDSTQPINSNGTSIGTNPLSTYKKLASSVRATVSFWEYLAQDGRIPVVSNDLSWSTWPLDERFCKIKLILHQRGWEKESDLKKGFDTFCEAFLAFLEEVIRHVYVIILGICKS